MSWAIVPVLVDIKVGGFSLLPLVGWSVFAITLSSLRGLHSSVKWLRRFAIAVVPISVAGLFWNVDYAGLFASGSTVTHILLALLLLVPVCFVWAVIQIPIDLALELEQSKLERKLVRRRIGVMVSAVVLYAMVFLDSVFASVDLEDLFPAGFVAFVLWAISLAEYAFKLGRAIDVYRS